MTALARRRPLDDRGAVIVLWALLLAMLCGCAALALDLGNIEQTHQNAQDAADAAAVSGAEDLYFTSSSQNQVVTDVEGYVHKNYPTLPGSGAIWDTCPLTGYGSVPAGYSAPTNLAGQAQDCISFNTSTTDSIINVAIPPQSVRYTLGRAEGQTTQSVTAVATASFHPAPLPTTSPCGLCVLGPSGQTLTMAGGASLEVDVSGTTGGTGTIIVNSTGNPASCLNGTNAILRFKYLKVVGTENGSGGGCKTSTSNYQVENGGSNISSCSSCGISDPLAFLSPPSVPGTATQCTNCSGTLSPGVYGSVCVQGGNTLTLQAGVYVFTGAGLKSGAFSCGNTAGLFVAGGATVNASAGSTLYFTCSGYSASNTASCRPPQGQAPNQTWSQGALLDAQGAGNSGSLDLAGSCVGTGPCVNPSYRGLAIYYDPNNGSPIILSGNSGTNLKGTIYAKASPQAGELQISGTPGSIDSLVVVGSVAAAGDARNWAINYVPSDNVNPNGEATLPTLCSLSVPNC